MTDHHPVGVEQVSGSIYRVTLTEFPASVPMWLDAETAEIFRSTSVPYDVIEFGPTAPLVKQLEEEREQAVKAATELTDRWEAVVRREASRAEALEQKLETARGRVGQALDICPTGDVHPACSQVIKLLAQSMRDLFVSSEEQGDATETEEPGGEGHVCDGERPCEPNDHLCRNCRPESPSSSTARPFNDDDWGYLKALAVDLKLRNLDARAEWISDLADRLESATTPHDGGLDITAVEQAIWRAYIDHADEGVVEDPEPDHWPEWLMAAALAVTNLAAATDQSSLPEDAS